MSTTGFGIYYDDDYYNEGFNKFTDGLNFLIRRNKFIIQLDFPDRDQQLLDAQVILNLARSCNKKSESVRKLFLGSSGSGSRQVLEGSIAHEELESVRKFLRSSRQVEGWRSTAAAEAEIFKLLGNNDEIEFRFLGSRPTAEAEEFSDQVLDVLGGIGVVCGIAGLGYAIGRWGS